MAHCNAISPNGMDACELDRGHHGKHRSESFRNPPYHEWDQGLLGFADDLPNPTVRETVRGIRDAITGARPCCHTTGPNHHPACQESK